MEDPHWDDRPWGRPILSALPAIALRARRWSLLRGPEDSRPSHVLVVWYTTCVRIARSARRHGISEGAIRHAVTNAIRLIETDDGLFVIGANTSGRMLEVVARPTEAGGLIVFHAMPLRPTNGKRYLS